MAQHKSKRPTTAGATRDGRMIGHTPIAGTVLLTDVPPRKTATKRGPLPMTETIEARLDRKASIADDRTFATKSLGQRSREQRHKLLYGN